MKTSIENNNAKETRIFYLDYSKWRCGGESNEGVYALNINYYTSLLNKEGKMCCLGQMSLQLGCSTKDIYDLNSPEEISKKVYLLSEKKCENSKFSISAISINDNSTTTINQKIASLRKLLKAKNYKLIVINKPKK